MKSLNAKRIAAVAATLLMGLAVGAQGVSFGNVGIIANSGQPTVQIVVGSTAQPSDGVVAANIAAVIGNLALTTQTIGANVTGQGGVKCVVTTPTCTVTNQEVYIGEKGLAAPSGSYAFAALIGSVLNKAVALNSPANTKSLQTSGSQFAFPNSDGNSQAIAVTPQESPYSQIGYVPTQVLPTSATNGGGVTFNSFTLNPGPTGSDNIFQITNSNLPALANNWGGQGESENLWITGFPVYDQQQGVNKFAILDTGGAYQVIFNKPVQKVTSSGSNSISVPIRLLGQNWTILNETPPTSGAVGNVLPTNVVGGTAASQITLAQALTAATNVYVGHNVTNSSVGGFQVQLTDLGNQNTNGLASASLAVWYNGVPAGANATVQVAPFTTQKINFSGHILYIRVNQTFAGLYAYQKWAKIQLLSNVYVVKNNQKFNQTNDPGWYTSLLWTNTSSGGGAPWALQSIVIYNYTPVQTLLPGQSFTFIQNPAEWSVKFLGDNLGSDYDPVVINTHYQPAFAYQNLAPTNSVLASNGLAISNITEPAEELQVSSSVSDAFSTPGAPASTVNYSLTPYQLVEFGSNTMLGKTAAVNAVLTFTGNFASGAAATSWVNGGTGGSGLQVTITGYNGVQRVNDQVTFTAANQVQVLTQSLTNVTAIQLARALPANVVVSVGSAGLVSIGTTAANTLAQLQTTQPAIVYAQSNQPAYMYLQQNTTVGSAFVDLQYNQQNGIAPSNFRLTSLEGAAFQAAPVPNTAGSGQYFQYKVGEVAVATNTLAQDSLGVGIFNSTQGTQAASTNFFQLNYSTTGSRFNMSYFPSSQGSAFNVAPGFTTERGSQFVTGETSTSATVDMAKAYDTLQFLVGPASTTTTANSVANIVGPYVAGNPIANYPNVTIYNITTIAGQTGCTFVSANGTGSGCNVTGLSNLTATPSVGKAVVWPNGKPINTATDPIAVLDSQASNSTNQIVIGSAFVNSVAAQIFANQPTLATSFDQGGPTGQNSVIVQAFNNKILVAGYTANQTVMAGNQFITQLLQSVSTQ